MFTLARSRNRAFSLIELVIVVLIIGILAAIAVPRMSRGATAAGDSALAGNLAILRNAIDLFQTEHDGNFPALADVPDALTKYSNQAGSTFSATKDAANGVIYGPYLRKMPPLPVGADKGKNTFVDTQKPGFGWVYDATTGAISANCPDTEVDSRSVKYNTY